MQYASPASRSIIVSLALAMLLSLVMMPAVAQESENQGHDTEVSLSVYTTLLRQAINDARQASELQQESLIALAAVETVRLPDGSRVTVSPLLPDQGSERVLEARLRTLLAQIEASAGDETLSRLAILEEVLARPQFQTQTSLWQQIWRWLRGWLRQVPLPGLDTAQSLLPPEVGRAVAYAVAAIVSLLLIGLLSYWFQGLIRSSLTSAPQHYRPPNDDAAPVTAAEATRTAEHAAATGDFRHAVRQLYLAALLTLDEQNLISYSPSATNHEVLNQLTAGSAVRAQLKPMTETFDHVWYGVHEPDAPTFYSYQQDVRLLQQTIQQDSTANAGRRPMPV